MTWASLLGQARIDDVILPLNDAAILFVNVVLALIIFGVAVDLDLDEFKRTIRSPKGPAIGMAAQFVLLPALTFGLTMLLRPHPSIALGMILVASCPGGAMSNFLAHLGNGNASLSIGMTGISTLAAIVMTPLNLNLWGRLNPDTAVLLTEGVRVSPLQLVASIVFLLGVPVALGFLVQVRRPALAVRLVRPARVVSITALVGLVVFSFAASADKFVEYVGYVLVAVALHNGLGLLIGYAAARAWRLSVRDSRAVSIEVGTQNTALALALIFAFFDGLGGAALTAGWYGLWHILAGLSLTGAWRWRDRIRLLRPVPAET